MSESVTLSINDVAVHVPAGTTVAVAVLMADQTVFRQSVLGDGRGPVCGMGICFECRVTIDEREHCRSCQIVCQDGMKVLTE